MFYRAWFGVSYICVVGVGIKFLIAIIERTVIFILLTLKFSAFAIALFPGFAGGATIDRHFKKVLVILTNP